MDKTLQRIIGFLFWWGPCGLLFGMSATALVVMFGSMDVAKWVFAVTIVVGLPGAWALLLVLEFVRFVFCEPSTPTPEPPDAQA